MSGWQKTKYPGIFKNEKGDYKVRYRIPNGDARSKTFLKSRYPATLKAALDFQAETRKAKNEGQMTDPKAGRVTLGEYARTKWYPSKVHDPDIEPRTLTNHRTRLGIDREGNSRGSSGHYGFLSTMPIRTITYSDIERWRNDFHEDHAPTTVNGSLATLNQIFNRARRDRLVTYNPCDDVSRLKSGARRLIIPASLRQIRALADAHPDRYRSAILVAAFTGLRAGELWALRRDRVNEVKCTIDVVEAVKEDNDLITGPTKTKERRTISIDKETVGLLSLQMNEYPSESGLIFTTERGCQVRHSNFKEDYYVPIVKSLGDVLPIAKSRDGASTAFRFLDLRHSHASHLIARGAALSDVADRLGHASTRTTEDWYKHLFKDHDAHIRGLLEDLARETLAEVPSEVPSEVSRVLSAS